jgi:hypothetical protein
VLPVRGAPARSSIAFASCELLPHAALEYSRSHHLRCRPSKEGKVDACTSCFCSVRRRRSGRPRAPVACSARSRHGPMSFTCTSPEMREAVDTSSAIAKPFIDRARCTTVQSGTSPLPLCRFPTNRQTWGVRLVFHSKAHLSSFGICPRKPRLALLLVLLPSRGLLVLACSNTSLREPHLKPPSCHFAKTLLLQGTPSCLTCPPPESHQPCSNYREPQSLQTSAMTHIANCMRRAADESSVYITQETSTSPLVSARYIHLQPNGSQYAPPVQVAEEHPGRYRHSLTTRIFGEEPLVLLRQPTVALAVWYFQIPTVAGTVFEEPCGTDA